MIDIVEFFELLWKLFECIFGGEMKLEIESDYVIVFVDCGKFMMVFINLLFNVCDVSDGWGNVIFCV